MIDLSVLRDAGKFTLTTGRPRLALVHHGFRTTELELIDGRKTRFSARYASLGLLNLARSLQVDFESGRISYEPELKYFDEDCYENDDELLRAVVEWLRPAAARFVLAGVYTLAVERTAALLSMLDPTEVCIVVGGAHPTVAPRIDYAHIVVRGEGGLPMRHLLTRLFEPSFGDEPEAKGICYELDGHLHVSAPAFDNSLATIPAPAFAYDLSQSRTDFINRPRDRWWKATGKNPQIYVCTQSCRARCTFCSTYLIHGRLTSRPAKLVEQDLDYIIDEHGHDSLQFFDDDLLQHDEFDQLMELLQRKRIAWSCNARSEFMTHERARQMFASGCRKVFLGVESFDQRSLDYYRKGTTVEMNRQAIHVLDEAGVAVVCGYIIGAPHETLDSILADIDRMLELPIFFLSGSILTPDIGSVEYLRARKTIPALRLLGDDGSDFNLKPRPELFGAEPPFGMPTVCTTLSKAELNELYELAESSFFLRESSFERITRLSPPDQLALIGEWFHWNASRAEKLARTARLGIVRERAAAVLAGQPLVPEGPAQHASPLPSAIELGA